MMDPTITTTTTSPSPETRPVVTDMDGRPTTLPGVDTDPYAEPCPCSSGEGTLVVRGGQLYAYPPSAFTDEERAARYRRGGAMRRAR